MTSKAPFTFPLLAGDIALFCHPSAASPFHLPHFLDGDLTAGNHHIAIRARRGRWMECDFSPPPDGFKERLGNLPWHRFPDDGPEWRPLDDIRGLLYAHAPINPWKADFTPSPSPVWRIGHHHRVRLSHLQLLARLPRCMVYAGPSMRPDPLFIRFNAGTAIMPPNGKLTTHSREIFAPAYDCLTKERRDRSNPTGRSPWVKPLPPEQPVDNWPPLEPDDD
jgi:hypothetical protein